MNGNGGNNSPSQLDEVGPVLFEEAPVLLWLSARDGGCTYFNKTWLGFTGRTLEDEVGDGWAEGVHPEDVEDCLAGYRHAFAGRQPFELEYRLRRADGQYRWVVDRATPRFSPDGAFLGYIGFCHDITDLKLFRRFSEQAEERLNGVVNSAMDAIITIDASQRISLFNAGAERIFACTSEAAIGRPIDDFIPEEFRAAHGEHIRAFGASGTPERQMSPRELRGLRASGEEFPAEARISQAEVSGEKLYTVILRDITARKRAQDDLRFLADVSLHLHESLDYRETLQTIARVSVGGFADWCSIHLLETDGRVSRVAVVHNDPKKKKFASALQRTGTEDWLVRNVVSAGRPVFIPQVTEALLAEYGMDAQRQKLARNLGLASLILAPLIGRAGCIGTVSFVRADSGRLYDERHLEVALEFGRRAGLAVENARLFEQLREANAVKDEFLSMVSHELRTPMTTIAGLSGFLVREMERMDPQSVREALEHLRVDSLRLQALIENLLMISRLEQEAVELEPVVLHHLVSKTIRTFRRRHPGCAVEYSPEVLPPAIGHAAWITHVVENLLGNAHKYSSPEQPIDVELAAGEGRIAVRILDRGEGIPDAEAEHVFERFYRTKKAERMTSGAGLGLAVCRRLMELQGGSINCRPREGGGTVFEFVLPLALEDGP